MPTPLSVILPAYNEDNRIETALRRLRAWQPHSFGPIQVIIVDDGSTDQTRDKVRQGMTMDPRVELVETTHVGAMNAILAGVQRARFDLIGILEADLAADPDEFNRLLPYLDSADFVIGSRLVRGDLPPIEGKSTLRRLLSLGMSTLFRLLFVMDLRDPQIGFKLYKRPVLEKVIPTLTLKHDGMKSTEILVRAYAMGYRIAEVPVLYRHDSDSRAVSRWPLRIAWNCQVALLQIWTEMAREYRQGRLKRPATRGTWLAQALGSGIGS